MGAPKVLKADLRSRLANLEVDHVILQAQLVARDAEIAALHKLIREPQPQLELEEDDTEGNLPFTEE